LFISEKSEQSRVCHSTVSPKKTHPHSIP